MDKIKLGSDNLLKWENFTNAQTGARITGATVTAKLYDANESGGPTQLGAEITLNESGTDGDYYGTIADDHADLVAGMTVRVEITADKFRIGPEAFAYHELEGRYVAGRRFHRSIWQIGPEGTVERVALTDDFTP